MWKSSKIKNKMTNKILPPLKPKKEWARLYAYLSEASVHAEELLRNAGYRVITVHYPGKMGPTLKLGRKKYYGLEEITEAIKSG